jgi:hypothetical protein
VVVSTPERLVLLGFDVAALLTQDAHFSPHRKRDHEHADPDEIEEY